VYVCINVLLITKLLLGLFDLPMALLMTTHNNYSTQQSTQEEMATRKPRKGAAVIAASMHGFANCRKFKSPVTLTLDRVKVTSIYTVRVELVARPTM